MIFFLSLSLSLIDNKCQMYNLIDTILNLVHSDVYFFFENKENNEQPAC